MAMLEAADHPGIFTSHAWPEQTAGLAPAGDLVTKADQPFQVISLPEMAHSMHGQDPQLFTSLLAGWARRLDTP
jgi:hypothetical protein